jgi:uncharacterized protein (TIGR02118 family)
MHCATVVYSNKPGAKFDFDYYLNKHVPMVAGLFGTEIEVRKGISSAMGSLLPFVCIARISINSVEHFEATMAQHGARILSDVANYTNIEPFVQIDEVVRDR